MTMLHFFYAFKIKEGTQEDYMMGEENKAGIGLQDR